ncbi:hypothetical protein LL13F56_16500 [Escherichia coli]
MQVLNSQRKAFLDMVAWSEGTDDNRHVTTVMTLLSVVNSSLITPITLANLSR